MIIFIQKKQEHSEKTPKISQKKSSPMKFLGYRPCHYCSNALRLRLLVTLLLLVGISSERTFISGLSKERSFAIRLLPNDVNLESESSQDSNKSKHKPKHKPKKDSSPKGIKEINPLIKPEEESDQQLFSFGHPSTFLQLILAAFILFFSLGIHYWKMKRSKQTSRRKGLDYAPISTNGGETEMTGVNIINNNNDDDEEEEDEIDAEYGEEDDSDDLPRFTMRPK